MRPIRLTALVIAILALTVPAVFAQPIISAKSGVIAGVEGKVFLDNQPLESSVTHFPDMKENAVLRTEEGRAEVLLPPGYILRVGENASFKMLTNRLIDTRVEMLAGSGILEVDDTNNKDANVVVALKAGAATIVKAGVYRFDSDPARIRVFSGSASVLLGDKTIQVPTGHMLGLTGDGPLVEKFDTGETDALDHWARRRAEAMAVANVSAAKYVNDNYGKLNQSSWGFNPYFGLYTYIPMNGTMCNSYYDYCYYSPMVVYDRFYAPMSTYTPSFGQGPTNAGYSTMGTGQNASSNTVAAAPSVGAAPAVRSGSTASSAAASSSAGHGSAASGGGHGK